VVGGGSLSSIRYGSVLHRAVVLVTGLIISQQYSALHYDLFPKNQSPSHLFSIAIFFSCRHTVPSDRITTPLITAFFPLHFSLASFRCMYYFCSHFHIFLLVFFCNRSWRRKWDAQKKNCFLVIADWFVFKLQKASYRLHPSLIIHNHPLPISYSIHIVVRWIQLPRIVYCTHGWIPCVS